MKSFYAPNALAPVGIPDAVFTPKQIEYLRDAHTTWNIAVGATRSGKSFLGFRFLIPYYVLNSQNKGLLCIIGNSLGTINRNVLEPMRKFYPGCVGETRLSDSSCIMFGRKVFLIGADRSDRVAMIQGSGIEYAYGDEIPTWSEEFFQMLKSRLDSKDARFDGTGNPDNPNHWFKVFIDETMKSSDERMRKSMYYQHYTIDDNPTLDPDFVHRLKQEYRGTVFYHRYILGEWKRAEGLIYQEFSEERHTVAISNYRPFMQHWKLLTEDRKFKEAFDRDRKSVKSAEKGTFRASIVRIRFAADIGHSNATAFLAIGEGADGRLYVLDEWYHSGKKSHQTWSAAKYAKMFVEFHNYVMSHFPMSVYGGIYVDPSALGFMAALKDIKVFSIVAADNNVLGGIQFVANMISSDKLRIATTCVNLLDEIVSYSWDEEASDAGRDEPIKEDDHCFVGDTIINTVDGPVPIRGLVGKTGRVWCYDEQRKCATTSTFRDVRKTRKNAEIFEVSFENGRSVKVTGDHLMLTEFGWKQAQYLTASDKILDISSSIRYTSIRGVRKWWSMLKMGIWQFFKG